MEIWPDDMRPPPPSGWRGPIAMTSRGGSLYIGTLTPFPVKVGAAEVFKVNPRTGQFRVFATGLTTMLGLAFGQDGALYVLEMRSPGQRSRSDRAMREASVRRRLRLAERSGYT
jgi:hypothetical protein